MHWLILAGSVDTHHVVCLIGERFSFTTADCPAPIRGRGINRSMVAFQTGVAVPGGRAVAFGHCRPEGRLLAAIVSDVHRIDHQGSSRVSIEPNLDLGSARRRSAGQ